MAGTLGRPWRKLAIGLGLALGLLWLWRVGTRRRGESMDFTFEFGETTENGAFFERHPNFYPALEGLCALINRCFARPIPRPWPEYVCFSLGESCREDFLEILFLAANGYGPGASKLLRGLYERAVALAYMVKDPAKAERFARFAAVQEHKALKDALKVTTEEQWNEVMGSGNTAAEIRNRFETVKEEFEQTDTYYLMAYANANLEIHATLASALREDNRDQDARRTQRREQADTALFCAAMLLVEVLRSQNTLFALNLSDELQVTEEAIATVWKDSIDARP